jgi:hypothetical protein
MTKVLSQRIILILTATVILGGLNSNAAHADGCITPSAMEQISGMGYFETCGGDDETYRISLPVPIRFGDEYYSRIYATTNSVVTFGIGDGNYSSFPYTPSISLQASDWVERGIYAVHPWFDQSSTAPQDEFLNIEVTTNGFTVDLQGRPYSEHVTYEGRGGQSWSEPIRNTFTVAINPDNSISVVYFSSSSSDNFRNGCVLSPGADHISLEECGLFRAATFEDIQLLIAQIAEEIIANTEPINEPVQKSVVTGTSFNKTATQAAKTTLVIQGQFIEEILNIDVNGMAISRGDWVQNPTSVSITVSENSSGIYKVQLYNQAVPLVPPQLFVISQK